MGLLGVGFGLGDDIGVVGGDVEHFADIFGEVVEAPFACFAGFDGFPMVDADGGLLAELPVEVFVLFLVAGVEECGEE